jgi:hypothetical protein
VRYLQRTANNFSKKNKKTKAPRPFPHRSWVIPRRRSGWTPHPAPSRRSCALPPVLPTPELLSPLPPMGCRSRGGTDPAGNVVEGSETGGEAEASSNSSTASDAQPPQMHAAAPDPRRSSGSAPPPRIRAATPHPSGAEPS